MNISKLDRAMCGDIWSSDTMGSLLRGIASFGHRFCGSSGESNARKLVKSRLEKWGLRTRLQRFKVDTWSRGVSSLKIPALQIDLPCQALVYSASTGGRVRNLEVVDLFEGTPGDFERNRGRIRGRAVLFSRKDYQEHGSIKGWSRYGEALRAGAAAFIVGTYRSPGVISASALSFEGSKPGAAPAVAVSGESVAVIRRAMERGRGRVALSISCENVSRFSGNVEGVLPGRRHDQEIVVGAHLDSFDISPGADDNGSGVVVVCELARLFATHRVRPERTLRFVFFTGEELGRLGSEKYAGSLDAAKVGLYFNFDLPANGGYPRLTTMTGKSDPEFWFSLMKAMHYRFPVREIMATASDHYSFYRRGIPCIWEISGNSGTRSPAALHHTALDNLEYVNPNELKEAATMASKILLFLSLRKGFPFRALEPPAEGSVPHWS